MRVDPHHSFLDPDRENWLTRGDPRPRKNRTLKQRVADLETRIAFKDQHAPREPTCRLIIELVALESGISQSRILSPSRLDEVVSARHAAIWLAREVTRKSMPQIGLAFDRDHSTVIDACHSAERRRERDPEFRAMTDRLRQLFAEPF